jgi:hypothetical protein
VHNPSAASVVFKVKAYYAAEVFVKPNAAGLHTLNPVVTHGLKAPGFVSSTISTACV